jgi:hypothetical protein
MKLRNFFVFLIFWSGLTGQCFAQITAFDVTKIKIVVMDYERVFGAVVNRCSESHPDHAPRFEASVHNWLNDNRNSLIELREMYPKLTKYFPEADRTGYQPTPEQIGNMMTDMFLHKIANTDAAELHRICSGGFEEKTLKDLDFTALLIKIKNEK